MYDLAHTRHGSLNAMSVPSPCIQICTMDSVSGYCQGCWRTLDEIAAWSSLGDADKLRVWRALRQRQIAAHRPLSDTARETPQASAGRTRQQD
jgi:predicted Fe-S protein YdhL (DUF1289 family)